MFSLFNNIFKIFVKAFLKLDIPVYILFGIFSKKKKLVIPLCFSDVLLLHSNLHWSSESKIQTTQKFLGKEGIIQFCKGNKVTCIF